MRRKWHAAGLLRSRILNALVAAVLAHGCMPPSPSESEPPAARAVADAESQNDSPARPSAAASERGEATDLADAAATERDDPPPSEDVPPQGLPMDGPPLDDPGARLAPTFGRVVTVYPARNSKQPIVHKGPHALSSPPSGSAVVETPGAGTMRASVRCESEQVSVRVFVPRSNLAHVVTRYVLATPRPGEDSDEKSTQVGVSLAPGAVVTVSQRRGDQAYVSFHEEVVKGSGWIPKSALGEQYVVAETDPRALPSEGRERLGVVSGLPVRVRPGGRAFATITGPVEFQPLDGHRKNHQLGAISFVLETRTYAIGWMPTAALDRARRGTPAVGGAIVQPRADPPPTEPVSIPAGSTLHSKDGKQVGHVLTDVSLQCLDDCTSSTPVVELACVARLPLRARPPN